MDGTMHLRPQSVIDSMRSGREKLKSSIHATIWRYEPVVDNSWDIIRVCTVGEEVKHTEGLLPVSRVTLDVTLLVFAQAAEGLSHYGLILAPLDLGPRID